MRRLVIPLVAVLPLTACDSSPASPGVAVRDSAGIRIVENRAPAWSGEGGLRVAVDPAVAIGSLDGPPDQQLYRVRDATRLPDGRVVVLNSGSSEIRIYSPEGALLRTVGRQGGGPGEFQHPEWVALMADTLLVYDGFQENGRLSVLDLEGELIRSEPVSVGGIRFPRPDFVLPGGTYLDQVSEGSIGLDEEGHVVYTRHIVSYPRTPSAMDTLISGVPGGELYRERFMNGMSQTPVPFGREGRTAVGADRIYLGDGREMRIDGYGLDGRQVISIRVETEEPAITEAEVGRWIEATLSHPVYEQRPDAAERARSRFLKAPVPDVMPAHAEMIVDAEDRLWTRRYSPPWEEANEWWVFDRDGTWLGAVSLPPGLEVLEIGTDYVLGLRTDDLDVEYLELYEVEGAG